MKQICLTIWLGIGVLLLVAQSGHAQECGAIGYQQNLKERFPLLHSQYQLRQQQLKQQQTPDFMADALITIPVVVHIVFNNAAENLPNDRVFDQIEILNEDFRRLNLDIAVAPNVFRNVSADIGIQFCLASVDPDGNPTNGITRTATSHGVFQYPANSSINDDVKYTADGGIDAWDTDRYLNIWVCDINDGIRGYAPYPGTSPAAEDGVVIDFQNFGSVTASRGRTAAHEVGHWLNLIHIWGDAQCGDDQVGDTPVAEDSNGGCPNFPHVSNICMNGPNGEMFVNHMDYSDHTCRVMFTQGQRDRMLANFIPLVGARVGLLTSNGCGNACPIARFVTSNFNGDNLSFDASSFVVGWSQLSGGSQIEYVAGDSVRMDPGFHATPGNTFRAWINPCTNNRPSLTERNTPAVAAATLICQPNPFADDANIRLVLPQAGNVSLHLYDLNGRLVRTLAHHTPMTGGEHQFPLVRDAAMAPGVYYLRLFSDTGISLAQKIVIQ